MDVLLDVVAAIGWANGITVLAALNFIAFAAFGIDKSLAEAGNRRISEQALLLWAFLGGTPGAYAGRALFRHKTRKQPFSQHLHAIAFIHVIAIGAGVGWVLGAR
jgi:uncharacterized membrane protein YsdA (DUF1294 family)